MKRPLILAALAGAIVGGGLVGLTTWGLCQRSQIRLLKTVLASETIRSEAWAAPYKEMQRANELMAEGEGKLERLYREYLEESLAAEERFRREDEELERWLEEENQKVLDFVEESIKENAPPNDSVPPEASPDAQQEDAVPSQSE